jgi:hypothetical protein
MFYFITSLVGGLVVLLAVTLIYKAIKIVFKSVSNFIRPVSGTCEPVTIRNSSAGPQKKSKKSKAVHDSLIPLDRRNHEMTGNWTKTHPVDPDPHRNQNFEWLLHERKSALVQDSYTVRRRCTPTPPTLDMVSKPFRHKRAPWVLEHEAPFPDNPDCKSPK